MTVIDISERARRHGVNPSLYRRASRSFTIIRSQCIEHGESTDFVSVLRKMPNDEIAAYVKYHEYDKLYPNTFDRNGFIKA